MNKEKTPKQPELEAAIKLLKTADGKKDAIDTARNLVNEYEQRVKEEEEQEYKEHINALKDEAANIIKKQNLDLKALNFNYGGSNVYIYGGRDLTINKDSEFITAVFKAQELYPEFKNANGLDVKRFILNSERVNEIETFLMAERYKK